MSHARISSLSRCPTHQFSKQTETQLTLLAGLGVEGDAHCGEKVKHRSRVAANPDQPNLRQVHLIHAELLDELNGQGFTVAPGDLGENILTRGIPLLDLPTGTRLRLGEHAEIEFTGLRNPCAQIENFQKGLLAAVLGRAEDGSLIRKGGVMAVVLSGGVIQSGDAIQITLPAEPHRPLEKV
ncbi:MOSC domain-containing protein [Leeia aquatica]|uniref:MOSC domain-containing protein n=1 Tax=Leeia aquatica TaxID=2725557 RepID=A0A847S9L8_9NEIS|nr:MOSC domain-containing protein [Leeia aquatica]NLR75637.1 MOSC domain-containing protein [Leeia aquatica]